MGFVSALLGDANPIAKYVAENQNKIHGAFAGFGQGPTFAAGLGNAALGANQGEQQDTAYATAQKAEAERVAQINKTREALQQHPDLLAAFEAGDPPAAVFGELFKRMSPGYGAEAVQQPWSVSPGETLVDPTTKQPIFTGPVAPKEPTYPTGYTAAPDGKGLTFIPGGPADPSTAGKTTEATRRNQQLAKVMLPEAQTLLGDGTPTNPGLFDALSNGFDMAKANSPWGVAQAVGQGPSAEYQQAQNSLKTIIASYLYSVSGATANPGEVQTQADILTPKLNESPESIARKKARVAQMVQAVVDAAKGTNMDVPDMAAPGGAPNIDELLKKYQ